MLDFDFSSARIAPRGRLGKGVALTVFWVLLCAGESLASCPTSQPANYAGKTINNYNFSACPKGSLIKADFSQANLSGSTFTGVDLTGANFSGAKLGPTPNYPPVSFTSALLKNTRFTGADMPATNFEFATLHCADFSDSNLLQANFGPLQNIVADSTCRTRFVGAELSVNLITDAGAIGGRGNWGRSDFSNADFHDMDPNKVNFRDQNLAGAILTGTRFLSIDFTGANLTGVKFNKATLQLTTWDNAALNGADFTGSDLSGSSFICAQGFGANGGTQKADGSACPKAPATTRPNDPVNLTNSTADDSDFTGAVLTQAPLSGATLTRSKFHFANLAQANFQSQGAGTSPAQVKFSQFDRANLSQASLSSVDFSGTSALGANFSNTTFNRTNFSTARLDTADFSKTIVQETNFSQASLKSAQFVGAQISQPNTGGAATDFSCAQMGGANWSNADIKAALFNNAVMVAEQYCCPAKQSGGPPYCGIIDSLGIAYAQTQFPNISGAAVKCPNNAIAETSGSGKKPLELCPDSWRLAPNWTTTGCSLSGQRTMWSINCNADPGNVVKFADENLKKCILETLPNQNEVLISTAEQIQSVNCPARQIAAIGGLEYFTAMHTLDLSGNQLTAFDLKFKNIQPNDAALISLNLDNNQLTQLDLISIPSIEFLSVSNNALGGIALNANTYLMALSAAHNKLGRFDLALQSNLYYADLSFNQLTDVLGQYASNLDGLRQLSFLNLSNNALTTIGSISGIAANNKTGAGSLTNLYLNCNARFSCGDLQVYDGTLYPAAASSGCSVYDPSQSKWIAQSVPICN